MKIENVAHGRIVDHSILFPNISLILDFIQIRKNYRKTN